MLVQILQCIDDLSCVALHLQFMKSLPPLQQLVHALVRAEFEQDVDILTVFKEVLEVADVGVLNTAMNLDLAHQLLLRSTLGQAGLLDDFGRMYEACVGIYELVALGEATLSKEAASAVFDNLARLVVVFWVHRLNFLFNNLLQRAIEM